jgi:hypothetical protein
MNSKAPNRDRSFWKEEVPKFLDAYPKELTMEKIRWKNFKRKEVLADLELSENGVWKRCL